MSATSSVSPELKKILACPRCLNPNLSWHEDRNAVDCESCRLSYEIQEGIPVMLVDQAKPLSATATP